MTEPERKELRQAIDVAKRRKIKRTRGTPRFDPDATHCEATLSVFAHNPGQPCGRLADPVTRRCGIHPLLPQLALASP